MTLCFLSCFPTNLLHILVKTRGKGSLKHELAMEKDRHPLTWAKYIVLLAKANKLEGEVIDKEEKLSKDKDELNDILRNFKELKEAQRNS